MMKVSVIAGGAGFVGCNLLPLLAKEDRHLVVMDNLCRGREEYLDSVRAAAPGRIHFIHVDLSKCDMTIKSFESVVELGKIDEVWHLAANSDIPAGVSDANIDLRDTFMTTFSILEAINAFNIPTLHFASSSAIYGDLNDLRLHEEIGPLFPISNYGAMKLSSEAMISAAVESYLNRANVFRFPNVVGAPATHGVLLDFIKKLKVNGKRLDVLGDGTQQKAYLHVSDLVDAMLHIRRVNQSDKIFAINIGPIDDGVSVRFIANSVVERISPFANIQWGQGNKGWVGDVPKFKYSTAKLQALGWKPKLGSEAAVLRAIDEIYRQELDQ